MAYELPVLMLPGLTAGADLSGSQFYLVKLHSTAGQVVLCAAATDVPVGVLQNKPTAGQAAEVVALGITKVAGGAALSLGALIGPNASGQAAAKVAGTDTTNYVIGRVLEATGAAGGLATALVNCLSPHRAS